MILIFKKVTGKECECLKVIIISFNVNNLDLPVEKTHKKLGKLGSNYIVKIIKI